MIRGNGLHVCPLEKKYLEMCCRSKIKKAKFFHVIHNDMRLKAIITATQNKVFQEKCIILGNNI